MLSRTPEPELMDDREQAEAYAAADFATTDAACAEAFLAAFALPQGARVLDLGCGPGNMVWQLARLRPDLEFVGWDGAPAMITLARARQGLPTIAFEVVTLPAAEAPAAAFDAVISNSLLHHLHEPQVLWHTITRVARPGAPFFIQDLRRPASAEAAAGLVATHAADAPDVLRRDFLASLHAAFTVDEVLKQLQLHDFQEVVVEGIGDRHLRVRGRVP
jgi:2-polyprenyl-3-methyl-5-hydroxy-6-metoxy-1,4-benzoquinol methylase